MADVDLKVTCGCGWKTQSSKVKPAGLAIAEAKNHSEKAKHTLTIGGLVRKDSK